MIQVPNGSVGCFYRKLSTDESFGNVFLRKTPFGEYHVCVQNKDNQELYEIVAECHRREIAEHIVKLYK